MTTSIVVTRSPASFNEKLDYLCLMFNHGIWQEQNCDRKFKFLCEKLGKKLLLLSFFLLLLFLFSSSVSSVSSDLYVKACPSVGTKLLHYRRCQNNDNSWEVINDMECSIPRL